MPRTDPRVDAYIAKAQPFAKPILAHLRKVILGVSPDIVETVKWSHPAYEYEGFLCSLAAFKEHLNFGFWKHQLVVPGAKQVVGGPGGGFDKIRSIDDLPAKPKLVRYVKKAMALNKEGVAALHMTNRKKRPPLAEPKDLKAALAKNAKARAGWDAFSPSHRREYIEWITGAKQEETRARRLATTIAQVAEGKSQNWKYERK